MSADPLDELRAQRLRQRLWGATIVIALAVIILPLLLDGSGSESQFRRVERLREEPPRVINIDGTRETVVVPQTEPSDQDSWWKRMKRRFSENPPDDPRVRRTTDNSGSEPTEASTQQPRQPSTSASGPRRNAAISNGESSNGAQSSNDSGFGAWVVQAGSFRDEANAIAVRDRLRRAGYPSFVTLSEDSTVFRVRVGPMINKDQAGQVRDNVVSILGRDALVMPYP